MLVFNDALEPLTGGPWVFKPYRVSLKPKMDIINANHELIGLSNDYRVKSGLNPPPYLPG